MPQQDEWVDVPTAPQKNTHEDEWQDVPAQELPKMVSKAPAQAPANDGWEDVPVQQTQQAQQPAQDEWQDVAHGTKPTVKQNIKDYWSNWQNEYGRKDLVGKSAQLGMTALEGLQNTIGKPGSSIYAGLTSLLDNPRDVGKALTSAKEELKYGNQPKELSKIVKTVTGHEWEPTSLVGRLGKGALDLGGYIVTDPTSLFSAGTTQLGRIGKVGNLMSDLAKGERVTDALTPTQLLARGLYHTVNPVNKAVQATNEVMNIPVRAALDVGRKGVGAAVKGFEKVLPKPYAFLEDWFSTVKSKVPEATRETAEKAKMNMNATASNLDQIATSVQNDATKLGTSLDSASEKAVLDIKNKVPDSPYTKMAQNLSQSVKTRLDEVIPKVKQTIGFDLEPMVQNWNLDHFPRDYALKPTTDKPKEIEKIVENLKALTEKYQQEGNRAAANDGLHLIDLYESKLTGGTRKLRAPDYVPPKLDISEGVEKFVDSVKNAEHGEGQLFKGDFLKQRVMPDEFAAAFEPQETMKSYLKYWDNVNRDLTALDMIANHAEKNPGVVKRTLRELDAATGGEAQGINHPERLPKVNNDVANEAIDETVKEFPDIKLDDATRQHFQETVHGFSLIDKEFMKQWIPQAEAWQDITQAWKQIKLRAMSSVIRNNFEKFARGMPYGETFAQNMANQKLYLKYINGKTADLPEELRTVLGKVWGSGGSSVVNELKNAFDKPTIAQKVFNFSDKKLPKIVQPINKLTQKYFNETGKLLVSADEATKMSIFENQLKKMTGTNDLMQAIKDKDAVFEAAKFADDHIINFTDINKFTRLMRTFMPFFSFQAKAPAAYAKAFYAHPTTYLKPGYYANQINKQNLEGESESFQKAHKGAQNPISAMLNPFGPDSIYLGRVGENGEDFAEYNTAPMNLFSTNQGQRDFGKTGMQQLGELVGDYMGIGGNLAPISPAGWIAQLGNIKNDPGNFLKSLVQTATPTSMVNAGNLLQSIPAVRNTVPGLNALTPGSRAPNTGQAIMRALGQKIKSGNAVQNEIAPAKFQEKVFQDAETNIKARLGKLTEAGENIYAYPELVKQIMDEEYYKAAMRIYRSGASDVIPVKPE